MFVFAQGIFCYVCTILKRYIYSRFLIFLMCVTENSEKRYVSIA